MSLFNSMKAYGASISLHILILSSFWFASAEVTSLREEEPVTIDFSLGNGQDAAPAALQKPEKRPAAKKVQQPEPKVEEMQADPVETAALPDTQEVSMESADAAAADSVPVTKTVNPVTETGIAGGTSAGSQGKVDKIAVYLQNQFFYIRKIIAANMIYPETAREKELEGSLLLSFVIQENGSVTEVKIVKSSGHSILDEDAVATIYKSTPFPKPPFPAQLKIPITYKLM
jgi:periplasmic protein TonB